MTLLVLFGFVLAIAPDAFADAPALPRDPAPRTAIDVVRTCTILAEDRDGVLLAPVVF